MPVLTNLYQVKVGYSKEHSAELAGLDRIVWGDSDPWVPIEIPGALTVTIFQHIKPIRIEGRLLCLDVDSFQTVFYETDVQRTAGRQTAIDEWGGRRRIEYFHVWLKDHEGKSREFALEGVRIRQIEWPLLQKNVIEPSAFTVHFYAEKIEEVIPS